MEESSLAHRAPPDVAEAMRNVRTKRELAALFRHLGIHARKSLGQNFLVDHNLLEFMVRAAEVGPRDLTLDIGCGTGLLTAHLAEAGAKVIGIEVDRGLFAICSRYLEERRNVELVRGDALESKSRLSPVLVEAVSREWATGRYNAFRVISNLPYSVASLLVPDLLEADLPIATMIATVQREVAERMAASPGSDHYGALSLIVQAHACVDVLRRVPPDVFWPRPRVESAIVRMLPDPERRDAIQDYGLFKAIVRAAFSHRRKRLENALWTSGVLSDRTVLGTALAQCGIAPMARAEHVGLADYAALSNALAAHQG
jgi:16S rRNA (adenine1518-N6/adenine1519-N6)-dimethyltransferase